MSEINSQPQAALFRSIAAIVLISIFAISFLYRTDELSRQAERVAMEQMINEINVALSFVVYTLAVENRLDKLNSIDSQNPFYFLALNQKLPMNYLGEVRRENLIDKNGWFFDKSNKLVIYHSRYGVNYRYRLEFNYVDLNESAEFESEIDRITHLEIKKASNTI